MKNPPHPGDLIKTEIIEALGLNVSKAAELLKVRRATLSDLLHGKAALTPEMALRIEKAFGPDMDHLLRMQLAYDVARTRQHSSDIVIERYEPFYFRFYLPGEQKANLICYHRSESVANGASRTNTRRV